MFYKTGILKISQISHKKLLCWSHILVSPDGLQPPTQVLSCEICSIFKNTFCSGKMMNAWFRNCRSILDFMKKEIKDKKSETGRKMLGEQLSSIL